MAALALRRNRQSVAMFLQDSSRQDAHWMQELTQQRHQTYFTSDRVSVNIYAGLH